MSRLEQPFAQPGLHAAKLARPLSIARNAQRLLGTADIRAAAGAYRGSAKLAALYRYGAGLSE